MNFDDAIRAHTAWKFKLEAYLRKPDHSINSAELQRDNQCELGRWIYSQTDAHASDAILVELKKDHADFHRIAASLVEAGKCRGKGLRRGRLVRNQSLFRVYHSDRDRPHKDESRQRHNRQPVERLSVSL